MYIDDSLVKQAIEDRRYLHQHPELSGKEYETHAFIRQRLESLKIEILNYQAPSVVGFVKGTNGNKTIALRADIDALPIVEEGDKPYISKNPGVAHACGHDGHTAVLLAVADWLSKNREQVAPNIMLIFQSAEEITPSGADQLIQQGVLDKVDAIYGIHLWQGMEKGKIGLTHGPMMASVDDFEITIQGSGGHGSMPHETVDSIYVATQVIQAFQSIISRNLNPIDSGVITVGKMEAGTTYNIIPEQAKLIGTIRALTPHAVKTIQTQMVKLTEGICQAYGAKGQVDFICGTPPLVNDREKAVFIESVIRNGFGEDVLTLVDPVMGGEDFSYYLQKKPGAFIFVGMSGEKSQYPHHHPKFDLDEDVFPDAIKLFIEIMKNHD
ncbi:amidohydrolase [Neobacillus niacini]|uniref:M20 metallopeptidase family protein n=1 Tax=Neobacillus niacini TaxID=86668 RepID=UPI00052FB80A|nr:amidohydrolase [Neobacillus niacini]KGM44562.1 N-acyl-L-amino acid amidohydrolase [Neobacillus niacini]MEC1520584.1 amidohydrolase [Neobacillus niacini]